MANRPGLVGGNSLTYAARVPPAVARCARSRLRSSHSFVGSNRSREHRTHIAGNADALSDCWRKESARGPFSRALRRIGNPGGVSIVVADVRKPFLGADDGRASRHRRAGQAAWRLRSERSTSVRSECGSPGCRSAGDVSSRRCSARRCRAGRITAIRASRWIQLPPNASGPAGHDTVWSAWRCRRAATPRIPAAGDYEPIGRPLGKSLGGDRCQSHCSRRGSTRFLDGPVVAGFGRVADRSAHRRPGQCRIRARFRGQFRSCFIRTGTCRARSTSRG